MIKIYRFAVFFLLFYSCQKENIKEIKVTSDSLSGDKLHLDSVNSSVIIEQDTTEVISSNSDNPRLMEYNRLINESVLDGIPKENINIDGSFEGTISGNSRFGVYIDQQGRIYEGNITMSDNFPVQGEGKLIYPDNMVFVGYFGKSCDGTSWSASGKLYTPNGDYFVGCLKWHDRKLMTGTLYEGDQEYTFIDGRKIPK